VFLLNPSDVKMNKVSEKDNVGVFTFEPLPEGFGHTLGNTLRRILLTSIKGAAITQVKIAGVPHQFTTIEGIKEDAVEIVLNLKGVRMKMHSDVPIVGSISKTGPGKVTAGDIEISSEVEIVNKDFLIATLSDKSAKFECELVVESGVGYSPIEERETSKVGVILLDALFSPVVQASYEVEPTRMGRIIGLDKLAVTIETDGSILPSDALMDASTILRNFFSRFASVELEVAEEKETESSLAETIIPTEFDDVIVEELPLPTRTINALKKADIGTLYKLSKKTEEELSDIKNLGEKSIKEIKKLLKKEGFRNEA